MERSIVFYEEDMSDMLKKDNTTEGTEVHGVYITTPVFPPCNSWVMCYAHYRYSVVDIKEIAVRDVREEPWQ
jgi:hypothetical protein